ncbi:LysR family transcriptional regulator [Bordetella genomosp. 13]|uniref:LysR family transcriptional regulator n=1 Tax=Bordetella genomosp. 13 TaxID=463040 RepID=UPI0011A60623|nr:LysR family transcriptional regulator [Bordetella genomosp. 13]
MYSSERLKGIDVFVAVVEAGSFTAAAERLNLTNSAVGKAVARLEARLGVKLLARTTRRLALTDAGLAFHRTCLRVLGELEDTEEILKAENTSVAGRLRLDLPATYGKLRAMPRILDFLEQHPAVVPQISFTDRFVDLHEDGVDVAVRIGGSDTWPAQIGHRYLGHERRVFCCAPAYLTRRDGEVGSLRALQQCDAVLYSRADGTPSPWFIQRDQGPVEHHLPVARLEVGSAEAHVEAVLRGFGVAQLPTWLIDTHLESGELVELAPSLRVQGLPLYVLWLRSRQVLPRVDLLIEHLARTLRI